MGEPAQLLLAYSREGDLNALSALVAASSKWLMAYLRGFSPGEQDAEDAFQEVWVRVIKHGGAYRGGSAKAYLLRIAHSVVVDRFRRRGPVSVSVDAEGGEDAVSLDEVADPAPTPAESFESAVTAEDVRRAVRRLPEGPREVLLMRIEGEMPFKEIAATMGVPLGTALTWMHVATARLKKMIGGVK